MNKLKLLLFVVLLLILTLPFLQFCFEFTDNGILNGAFVAKEDTTIAVNGWLEGSYQKKKAAYLENEIGFKPWLVRFKNQFQYNVFNESSSTVVIGKEGMLFAPEYIDALLGFDYLGERQLEDKVMKLKIIEHYLAKHNTKMLLVFAPNKARLFKEYLPPYRDLNRRIPTNYDCLKEKISDYNIPFIDFNQLFQDWKTTKVHDLITKNGLHWTVYGCKLASDTIFDKMEHMGGENLHRPLWSGFQLTNNTANDEIDIFHVLNLLDEPEEANTIYPVQVGTLKGKKPKVVMLGDSFFMSFFQWDMPKNNFDTLSEYWYYNNIRYDYECKKKDFAEKDRVEILKNSDYLIVMATETNLFMYPFGLLENMAGVIDFGKEMKQLKRDSIQSQVREYIQQEQLRAKKEYSLVDNEELQKRAEVVIKTKWLVKDKHLFEESIRSGIIKDSEWFAKVKEQANKQHEPLRELIQVNVDYMYKNNGEKNMDWEFYGDEVGKFYAYHDSLLGVPQEKARLKRAAATNKRDFIDESYRLFARSTFGLPENRSEAEYNEEMRHLRRSNIQSVVQNYIQQEQDRAKTEGVSININEVQKRAEIVVKTKWLKEEIYHFKEQIRIGIFRDPEWFGVIKKQAEERHKPIEELIQLNIDYMYENNGQKSMDWEFYGDEVKKFYAFHDSLMNIPIERTRLKRAAFASQKDVIEEAYRLYTTSND